MIRALSFVTALLVCGPAAAQSCQLVATLEHDARAAGVSVVRLSGKEAIDYLAVMNAVEPATDYHVPDLIIAFQPAAMANVGRVSGNIACLIGRLPPKDHDRAMRAARGEPA